MKRKIRKAKQKRDRIERGAGKSKYSHLVGKLGVKDLKKYKERWDYVNQFVDNLHPKIPAPENLQGINPTRENYNQLSILYRQYSC